jgi:hypothetical protein
MPGIRPYAEVVGQEDVSQALVGVAGPEGKPLTGKRLGDFRAGADEVGRYLLPLSEDGGLIAKVYALNGDSDCGEVLDAGHVVVPLDHLDGLDDNTLVRVGFRIDLTEEESRLLHDSGEPRRPLAPKPATRSDADSD